MNEIIKCHLCELVFDQTSQDLIEQFECINENGCCVDCSNKDYEPDWMLLAKDSNIE